MSAVINRNKKIYRTALLFETLFLTVIMVLLAIWQKIYSISFFLGAISSFIPHCIFVYWVFYRQTKLRTNGLGAFYQGEIFKWISTIGLISAILGFYTGIDVIMFFIGYFIYLLLNSLLPMWFFSLFR